jgi:FAD/FMN-containing dehydrogenase
MRPCCTETTTAGDNDAVERRDFLAKLGRVVVASAAVPLLDACHGSSRAGSTTSGAPTSTRATTPRSTTAIPAPADLDDLARSLRGTLVRPTDASYPIAARIASPAFDPLRPVAVARCADAADVAACVDWARASGSPITARSGGHSYAGYSSGSGLVVDVGAIKAIGYDASSRVATVGAGAALIDIDLALAGQGVAVPGGSCPTVGIAGLALGGGMGLTGRAFGLTCDNVVGIDAVLADGRRVHCDATTEPDLFWGLRGGGGGNFAIVTAFTFRTHAVTDATIYKLTWPWSLAGKTLAAWMEWIPSLPDALFSACLLSGAPGAGPSVSVSGLLLGSTATLDQLLAPLVSAIATPATRFERTHTYADAAMISAGCQGLSQAACHFAGSSPGGTLSRSAFLAKSDYFMHPLDSTAIAAVTSAIERRSADARLLGGAAHFDSYGGAINRVAADATAFVHRNALCSAQYSGTFDPAAPADHLAANRTWLDSMYASLRSAASGAAYQNYIDPTLTDWRSAYYGTNYDRLVAVQRHYDPQHLFTFAQAVGR